MTFRGTYDYSLDAKNRLTVPAKFRASLSGGAVLAMGDERCVAVWTPESYDAFVGSVLGRLVPGSRDWQKLNRFYSANSFDTELDAAGRVMVPPFLLEYAGLAKEVVVAGAGTALEVWDRGAWGAYNDRLASEIPDITERLGHAA
jgi:MraZ protein